MAEDMQDTTQGVSPETISSNGKAGEALLPTVQGDASTWQRMVSYFQRERKGRYLLEEAKHTIQWIITTENATFRVVMRWEEKPRRLTVRVPHLMTMPQQKHIATALLMNLINGELFMGNFQLDPTDGEVSFRCSLAVADSTLTDDQLETYGFASLSTVDTFLPAFFRLRWADATPEEAFASVDY
jgi:hypothetical protein